MKKYTVLSILAIFLLTALSIDVNAQSRGKKKKKKTTTDKKNEYFDERGGDLLSKLWFGADANLNFGAFNGNSVFSIGISPMAGYKFNDNFSIGPRISLLSYTEKFSQGFAEDLTLNAFDIGAGIFARHKILQQYFVHAEYSVVSEERIDNSGSIVNNKIPTGRQLNSHYYLGVGYGSSAGELGFSAYALWDFSQDFTSTNIPIDIRFGITYRF